jgi:uncharacterized membrane protein
VLVIIMVMVYIVVLRAMQSTSGEPTGDAGYGQGDQGRVKSHLGAAHAFVADQLSMARYPLAVSTQPDGQESKAEVVQGAELILYAEPGSGSPPVPAACVAATHDTRLAPAPAM